MLAKTQIFWSFLIGIALSRAQSENDIAEEIKQKLRKWSATIINCSCVKISECPLVKDDQVKSLNANHPVRREWVTFFRDRICDKVKRTVMCCSEEEMTRNSGTWKPKGELGECGLDTSAPSNVIGGRFAKMGEFPYMVLLGYNRNGSIYYNCGASVINKWYIITAGHCVTSEFGAPAEIVLGEHTLGTDPDCMTVRGRIIGCRNPIIKRKVAEVILHPNYNVSERLSPHDIALIRVDEIIPFYAEENSKSSVLPICLPWNSEDPGRNLQQGDRLTITGWGKITNNARVNLNSLLKYQASARKLSKAKIPGVAIRKCQKENLYKNRLDPKVQLCAGGEEGVDSCGGDSGGPLAYKQSTDSPWYQVGIVSYGTRYCGQGTPGVYTRVSAFLAWIESNMKE